MVTVPFDEIPVTEAALHPSDCTATKPAADGSAVCGADQGTPAGDAGTLTVTTPSLVSLATKVIVTRLSLEPATAEAGDHETESAGLGNAHALPHRLIAASTIAVMTTQPIRTLDFPATRRVLMGSSRHMFGRSVRRGSAARNSGHRTVPGVGCPTNRLWGNARPA